MTQGVIRISELPVATAPLNSSAVTVVVQNGVTKKTSVSNINPDPVNVKALGATGDGVTDDSAAFNAAWQAIKLTGGSILVPPGRSPQRPVALRC